MTAQARKTVLEPATEKLLSPAELADRWSVSVETLKRRRRDGALSALKLGKSVRFKLSDILAIENASRI
jgi:excisionase family DNA binding protein